MPKNPFTVGGEYNDRSGSYEVLEIIGSRMRIRRENGQESTADIQMKARIHASMLAESRNLHPHQSAAYFRTLGFLARYGELHAEVTTKSPKSFEDKYESRTGIRPVPHRDKYFPIYVETNYAKWGSALRIQFPNRDQLEFPSDVIVQPTSNPGTVRINNNDYWWQLVRVGFRLGSNHNVQTIRESVPAPFRAAFDEGLGL